MEEEIERAYRLTAEQLRMDRYSSRHEHEYRKMLLEQQKALFEQQYLQSVGKGAFYFDDVQRSKDITAQLKDGNHRLVLDVLDYEPELLIRVTNIRDITELSHDVRRSCVHGVHLKYERQQDRLDIYFEKAQDYVLVKMFTE